MVQVPRCIVLHQMIIFTDELLNGPGATVYYAVPISPIEKEEQGKDFTKEEVAEMMKSEPYQKKISTCHL